MDAINPAHGSVLRVNSPSLGIFSLHPTFVTLGSSACRSPRLSRSYAAFVLPLTGSLPSAFARFASAYGVMGMERGKGTDDVTRK